MSGRSTDMTLALTVSALRQLADPSAAIGDAEDWTEYVGVVADDPNEGLTYTRERRIRVDFFSGTRSIDETLFTVGANYDTDRHVLVGTDAKDASIASQCGWEYQSLDDAAERAGWSLDDGEDGSGGGLLSRLWPR